MIHSLVAFQAGSKTYLETQVGGSYEAHRQQPKEELVLMMTEGTIEVLA